MFERVKAAPTDPILGLTEAFKDDPRTDKINLGVGIYKDENGQTPILRTVKQAEQRLLDHEQSKSYLRIEGLASYAHEVQKLLFGADDAIVTGHRAATAQTPGGTGALRTIAEFAFRHIGIRTIWVSDPTWANHISVFRAAGLEVKTYRYYDAQTRRLDFPGMLESLSQVSEGDMVLLHGCCHNPTGIDPTTAQWQTLNELALKQNWLPFFDFAYQGFGHGIDEDAVGLRIFAQSHQEMLIASSFSKNFGLYNERVGAATIVAHDHNVATVAFSQVKAVIRANYSNPPSHGAAIVTTILEDSQLAAQWHVEVAQMRERIQTMRALFVKKLQENGATTDFSFIEGQNGMFSFSGLNKTQVERLRDEFGVYIVGSGRINVAGMTEHNIDALCKAIVHVL
ncbi:amino acid aminotransferase [Celerinatantimonas yamalensis]|uniref:Aminotransferase n=1 Tax=Celerinatantimonas yamalensis TaxID=559956 RepID=A0ABW9G4L8_9GAMM